MMSDSHIRPAVAGEGSRLGQLHAQSLLASFETALERPLDPADNAVINPEALGQKWEEAIAQSPRSGLVFTALNEGSNAVGFAAVSAPDLQVDFTGTPLAEQPAQGEIIALEVPGMYGRQGHGSRLLAALTDTLKQMGATRIQVWIVAGDEAKTRFFHSAGFAPAGLRRNFELASGTVTEQLWFTDFQ